MGTLNFFFSETLNCDSDASEVNTVRYDFQCTTDDTTRTRLTLTLVVVMVLVFMLGVRHLLVISPQASLSWCFG